MSEAEIAASTVANEFYEHKNEEQLLKDAATYKVQVVSVEKTETSATYTIGGLWMAILYRKPGKPLAVTLRPILKA